MDEETMVSAIQRWAPAFAEGGIVYLLGDLGAGKTTLSRALLRGLGYPATVKSPTYTLLEPYELGELTVAHFDLYRLSDPEELEYLGLRDYLEGKVLWLVEWPQRGEGMLPAPDLVLELSSREQGRELRAIAYSERGRAINKACTFNVV
ncbi:MAG: tRNA (adenosine(37)-N6)-threonylcarbamoyltransferase complex ATPase subunit type 1 TsaE [Pseudomonadales bacterium]